MLKRNDDLAFVQRYKGKQFLFEKMVDNDDETNMFVISIKSILGGTFAEVNMKYPTMEEVQKKFKFMEENRDKNEEFLQKIVSDFAKLAKVSEEEILKDGDNSLLISNP